MTRTSTISVNCNQPGYTHTEGTGATVTKYVGWPKTCSLTTTTKCGKSEYTKTGTDDGGVGTNTVVVGKPSACVTTTTTSWLDCHAQGYTHTSTGSYGTDTVVLSKPAVCTVTTTGKFCTGPANRPCNAAQADPSSTSLIESLESNPGYPKL